VTGLIDYGAMDVESVAADLARLNGAWLPLPDGRALREEGMNSYASVARLDPNHIPIARAFEAAADVLIGERWVRWRFREGRVFDDPKADADGIARGFDRVRRLAARTG
jgi:Ser/Thr protein kinase RdoA (MazF antagonist)